MTHVVITFYSLILLLLILLAAFFSLAETGVMAVNRYRVRHEARLGKAKALRLSQLLKRPDRLLGAILIGNTFANMIASSLATLIAFHFWGDNGAILVAIILTFIVLIFAEITPKTLAAIYPDKVSQWVVYPISWMLKLLYPAVWIANSITNGLLHLLHVSTKPDTVEGLSREELRSIVYDTTGKISRRYQNMLLSILDLNKLTVDDVMVPRSEIGGIDLDDPLEKIIEKINKAYQDWVPVYQENINWVVGVLYLRDLYKLLLTEPTITKELLQQILQEPYFVPQGTSLTVQLSFFQQAPKQVAFIVDEYGDIQGLLTLYDILEEIIGDFALTMSPGKRIHQETNGSYLVDGTLTIREFNRVTNWELPLRGPRTINGLIIEYLETLPHSGTSVLVAGYPIEIMQVKENRVKLAKIFPRLSRRLSDHHHS